MMISRPFRPYLLLTFVLFGATLSVAQDGLPKPRTAVLQDRDGGGSGRPQDIPEKLFCAPITNTTKLKACPNNSFTVTGFGGQRPLTQSGLLTPPPANLNPPIVDPGDGKCDCYLTQPLTLAGRVYLPGARCPKEEIPCKKGTPETIVGSCVETGRSPSSYKTKSCDNGKVPDCQGVDTDFPIYAHDQICEKKDKATCRGETIKAFAYETSCNACAFLRPVPGSKEKNGSIPCEWVEVCGPDSREISVDVSVSCEWKEKKVPGTEGSDGYKPPQGNCFYTPLDDGTPKCQGSCVPEFILASENCREPGQAIRGVECDVAEGRKGAAPGGAPGAMPGGPTLPAPPPGPMGPTMPSGNVAPIFRNAQ